MVDPNMDMALNWANDLGDPPGLPNSLQDISVRKNLIVELDKPFLAQALIEDYFGILDSKRKKECLDKINQISKKYISNVNVERVRINICLRLWSGCLSAAKIIALETKNGKNTPDYRAEAYKKILNLADNDPIFKAGAKTAVDFKKSRDEEYSFEGIPKDSLL